MVSFFPHPCPQLPDFRSMLVRGPYHPSAPVHLLLSHGFENPEDKAVLLTPHRESFRNALIELNDRWLELHSGNGRSSGAAQRTQMFYPPTLAHLGLTLSMLHEYDDTLHHRKATLEAAPTLLVLHEPSAYFSAETTQATVSAYLSVVSSALALTSSWSPRR
ncbi:hypothetical protein LXA43DRAFT_662560 [Ganoderma leucocontextum]|nr:hypothetical protein LXA43DRAFT_662560 [Ganoderma leucocontextum]